MVRRRNPSDQDFPVNALFYVLLTAARAFNSGFFYVNSCKDAFLIWCTRDFLTVIKRAGS